MRIVISDYHKADQFAALFGYLQTLTNDLSMYFKEEHLYIQFMDQSHISFCETVIDKDWFTEYNNTNDIERIGVNVKFMNMILKCKPKESNFTIEITPDMDKMNITFETKNEKDIVQVKEFEMNLMEIDDDELVQMPSDCEWSGEMTLNSDTLKSITSELSNFGEKMNVKCSDLEVNFSSSGEAGNYKIDFDIDNLSEFSIEEDKIINVSFAMRFIQSLTSFTKLGKHTKLFLSEELPLRIRYDLDIEYETADDEEPVEPTTYIDFYLAPMMDQEDDY